MKKLKKILLLSLLGVVILSVSISIIREKVPRHYRLRQPVDQVVCVQIWRWDEMSVDTPVRTLELEMNAEEGIPFLSELMELECRYSKHNRLKNIFLSDEFVEIIYADGEIELIGRYNNGWIEKDEELYYGGIWFPGSAFFDLIDEYTRPRFRGIDSSMS